MYKIIAKILANHLVVVLSNLVNEVQSAFVADRQIFDDPFIMNELLQWCKSKKKHSLVFKVDFEKAYDSVRVVDAGMFKGITLGSSLHLSHMIYADDAIFVGQWSESNISTIVHVLDCFHRASGLHINMSKRKLMGISVDADKVDQAARKIRCVTLKTPFIYLGSKVGGLMSRVQSWNETVEGMVARLSKWKMKTLLIRGRLTLIKLVLGLMPIYHMSLFKVPMKVLQHTEPIRSHFFNGVERVGKKPIWVKWKNVLASKEKGSLGVSSLYALNRALMFKWVWQFFSHSSSLWARFIKAVHAEDGNIGKKEDAWRGDIAFKYLYPRVYALELCKSIDIASKMAQSNLGHSFRRDPRGGEEQAQFDLMLEKVEGTSLVNMRDRWVTSKTRWMKAVPIKVNVLAWKVKLDYLPTRLNVSRRGMDIESILCPMCGDAAESTRHIFFTCHIAREILPKISRWWDVSYTEVSSYEEWLDWILNLRLSVKYKQIFEGVCYVMWWHIWSFRNKSIFGSEYPSKAVIFEDVVSRSFYWCRYRCKVSFSWIEWLKNPHLVSL
ncbi:RNA-directed DNA polymerase, eukaryota, reverse transcriptase zinc-binding domain protein [Tanacetum coccineum]